MANATIGADVHQALDVHRDFGAQGAFDFVIALNHLTELVDVRVSEVANTQRRIDASFTQDVDGVTTADAVDVRKADLDLLLSWEIDARYTSH